MLILFAHPKCPCTRASIAEFERLLATVGDHASAKVVFFAAPGVAASWWQTDTWRKVTDMPSVEVCIDSGGREAARFGVLISGHVVLFDAEGRRQFSGGITASRGHEGDSRGAAQIRSILAGAAPATVVAPVFGCSIRGEVTGAQVKGRYE